MRIEAGRNGTGATTSNQILGEIREYCRATQTAESTFGRLVVNDGKLVSRLRDKVDKPFPHKLIHTVRGVGYSLRVPE